MKLTELTSYADAQCHFAPAKLWELFDGDRQHLNIGHECVDRHPRDHTAVRIAHANGRNESINFGELADWSNRVANELAERGVGPGDRVAMVLEPSLIFYAMLFGTMKRSAVAVPLFTLFGPDGLRLRLDDCDPALLVLAPEKADLKDVAAMPTVVADATFMADLGRQSTTYEVHTAADDMAMYQYTSGTSRDLPEAVKHRHKSVVTVIVAALYATGVRPGDRYMCPSSPAWGHGLWHGTLAPLALGVEIAAYAGPFDAARLLQALREFQITNLSAAATHYRMMKNIGANSVEGLMLEKLSFTGEAMDTDTADWARRIFGHEVCSIYGTTEVGVLIAGYPGADDFEDRQGSLGKPMPGVDVAVLDADGNRCPPDQVGEIMVHRRGAWFPTKDFGHVDGDGYFFHGGRADDVIISAGWTLSPLDMENILMKHPDVREVAVIGIPDDQRGQIATAHIVSQRSGDTGFVKELQKFAKTRLARHEYPRRVIFTDALPKTPAGKTNRRALRDKYNKGDT